jgi:hypothetical protein
MLYPCPSSYGTEKRDKMNVQHLGNHKRWSVLLVGYSGAIKSHCLARHQWLTPVILATQEAEIRRMAVQSQPGQIVPLDPILKKTLHKRGLVEWIKV